MLNALTSSRWLRRSSFAWSREARGERRLIAAAEEEDREARIPEHGGEGFIDHAIAGELLGAEFGAAPRRWI